MTGQLNIKNAATVHLARDVAQAFGESLTQAIHRSLEERLSRQKHDATTTEEDVVRRVAEFQAIVAGSRIRWKPEFDGMEMSTRHGDLLYDENGLPA